MFIFSLQEYWKEKIPRSLYLEIRDYLIDYDYLQFLNTSKDLFSLVKFETRKILLQHFNEINAFCEDESFRQNIMERIKDPYLQLELFLTNLCDINQILAFPKCSISFSRDYPVMNLHTADFEEKLCHRQFVHISGNTEITALIGIHSINRLFISGLTKLNKIESFRNIKHLGIFSCHNITDLACVNHVTFLEIFRCDKISDVSALGRILRLSIHRCPKITDISSLTHNRYLSIHGCRNVSIFMKKLFHTTSFETDLLYDMSGLCHLFSPSDVDDNQPRWKCNLRRLELTNFESTLPPGCFNHPIFENLFSLILAECSMLRSLQQLPPRLISLEVSDCEFLIDISGLRQYHHERPTLQFVCINGCPRLRDFSFLCEIPHVKIDSCDDFLNGQHVCRVKHLELVSCYSITDVSMLSGVNHLELFDCTQVNSLEGLDEVETLDVGDCDNLDELTEEFEGHEDYQLIPLQLSRLRRIKRQHRNNKILENALEEN